MISIDKGLYRRNVMDIEYLNLCDFNYTLYRAHEDLKEMMWFDRLFIFYVKAKIGINLITIRNKIVGEKEKSSCIDCSKMII